MGTATAPSFDEMSAPASWACADFISDLHLQPSQPATFAAWRDYLAGTPADAVFILGDLFEAWVGDDAALVPSFAADCARVLQEAAARRPMFLLHGNRDFLVGEALARRCGFRLLQDPAVLDFGGRRYLLSHGDALCLADTEYLRFRAQVRTPQWIEAFLARPLAEREAVARQLRDASQARHAVTTEYADADTDLTRAWLAAAGATAMIHGHTHRPADHDLGGGLRRLVLSDWDLEAGTPRAEALRLHADGRSERIALA
ncbi:UDP-2,3-diacylglucosamine diphosphatase [Ramlibacter sp. MAHUQ-53]|uniref:UDP-2,3-diacylglucosamine diphosphatase n=1 Tax=unclassified Ramlibacter TaxID=2617605 RepID=UPI003642E4DA